MVELKPLSREAIPNALAKAERYRLLNEPWQAESICQDVLQIDPENQAALVTLILALTEQFDDDGSVDEARDVCSRLQNDYERAYFSGIIHERRGKSILRQGRHGAGFIAYDWIRQAMEWYERAEAIRPPANDDALLRWNTCARFLMRHPHVQPESEERTEPIMSE
jgi:tetratricopeptide (TPR) repeat protein